MDYWKQRTIHAAIILFFANYTFGCIIDNISRYRPLQIQSKIHLCKNRCYMELYTTSKHWNCNLTYRNSSNKQKIIKDKRYYDFHILKNIKILQNDNI